jgi:hypothetical protein
MPAALADWGGRRRRPAGAAARREGDEGGAGTTAIQDRADDAAAARRTRLAALTVPAPTRIRLPCRSARRAVTGPPATKAMPNTATAIPAAAKLPVRWRNRSRMVSGIIVCAARPMRVPAKAHRTGRTDQTGP